MAASLLVRTWNLFHGNALPPERTAYLEQMVQLVSADRPDIVCLQEVPVWALPRLARWSSMTAVGDVARRPALGPLPWPAAAGRAVTALHPGVLRSAFTGQANAMLLSPALRVLERFVVVLNPARFRRAQARWLGLELGARLAWARARTICQVVRVRLQDASTAVVANLHATFYAADERVSDAEVLRAAVFADAVACTGELCVLAGDFNVSAARSRTLADLAAAEWRFSPATSRGVDHILVRGRPAGEPVVWARERRRIAGRVVSDHAPVELAVE